MRTIKEAIRGQRASAMQRAGDIAGAERARAFAAAAVKVAG